MAMQYRMRASTGCLLDQGWLTNLAAGCVAGTLANLALPASCWLGLTVHALCSGAAQWA
eukprot:COSAG01_NODE_1836_length_9084_cov_5.216472_3_plen_59_part_00